MKKILAILTFLICIVVCLGQAAFRNFRNSNDYYFGIPLPNLDSLTAEEFRKGEQLFNHLFTAEDNIISGFNGLSCTSCHNTPVPGGSGIYNNTFVPFYITSDSSEVALHKFIFSNKNVEENKLPQHLILRKTPSLFGLGLLESIDPKIIIQTADPYDLDMDGISGRINYLDKEQKIIGRFGWKANSSSVKDFVEKAYSKEIGISESTKLSSLKEYTFTHITRFVTSYLKYLSPPVNITEQRDTIHLGEKIFTQIGCSKCHLTEATTKSNDTPLNNIRIKPFTDLLLHDLTNDFTRPTSLQDKKNIFFEFKTPSLWGLNSTGPPYLHDGSASSIEDAIHFHNGEAISSKRNFQALTMTYKAKLVAFLKTL